MLEPFHLLILGAVTALGYILSQHGLDPREPQEVRSKVPIIGHLLGLMRYGMGYFNRIAYVPANLLSPSASSLRASY
jgi:hypothetical protein